MGFWASLGKALVEGTIEESARQAEIRRLEKRAADLRANSIFSIPVEPSDRRRVRDLRTQLSMLERHANEIGRMRRSAEDLRNYALVSRLREREWAALNQVADIRSELRALGVFA